MNKTESELASLLEANAFTVVHIDADWDDYRPQVAERIDSIREEFKEVCFAYIDCDQEQGYAKKIGLKNTPSLAYYKGSTLHSLITGLGQDIGENIRIMKEGDTHQPSSPQR